VIRAALERASTAPSTNAPVEHLEQLQVIDRCECGCDSVDFVPFDLDNRPKPIADAAGETPAGGMVGLLIWGTANAVTGIEVYDLGAGEGDIKLPVPGSIRPFHEGAA
jgi:hypothetical protein